MSENKDLMVKEITNPADFFKNANGEVEKLLEAITKEAKAYVPDIGTKKGRDDIASLAYKVARSKTYLDDLGKNQVAEMKKTVKAVDDVRKTIRDSLDDLKDTVRKPLTDWELAEKAKAERHEKTVADLKNIASHLSPLSKSEDIQVCIDALNAIEVSEETCGDLIDKANFLKDGQLNLLTSMLEQAKQKEADDAELEQLRKEKAAREAQEQKANTEPAPEQESTAQADTGGEAAETAQPGPAGKPTTNRLAEINRAVADAFVAAGASEELAKKLVTAIARGQVPHTQINYYLS